MGAAIFFVVTLIAASGETKTSITVRRIHEQPRPGATTLPSGRQAMNLSASQIN